MCGICGIVDYHRPVDRDVVDRMRDTMANRGPDDADTKILPDAGLGFRRLSIIDLSPRGRQPMSNEDGSIWLVFNGEIYNFESLRSELLRAGHRFTSDADSEVLVHGYEQWGIARLLERVNGMFAFAIWDAPRRTLHLARDRLGKKPLYYGWRSGRFLFASELKALWMTDPGAWAVRSDSIARFLYWTYLPGRETIYEDVLQLLPGHYLTLTPSGQSEQRYWRVSFADKVRGSLAEIVEQTDAMLTAAVRRRLRSDVPLGAFLSGGVDSGYVVSRMADGAAQQVRTFSMGTSDGAHDERRYARRVAEHCRTSHTEFEVTADAWSLLPRLVWEFGQPFGDAACVPTYYVARCARQHVTVALTGDGGDESFAGYSHHQGRYLGALAGHLVPTPVLDLLLRRSTALMDDGRRHWRASAARFLRYAHSDPLVNWGGATTWALHHLPALWAPSQRALADPLVLLGHALAAARDFDGSSPLDRALHHDLSVLLPFGYNVKVDVATMMSSLEARSPFQDREVVEWAARVPAAFKMRPWEKKYLLKRVAARWIPREVVYRPKHGFTIPHDAWFRGEWAAAAHDIIFSAPARARGYFDFDYLEQLWSAHAAGTARHGTRFWLLLWLELWFRMFVDRTLGPEDELPRVGARRSTSPV
jgi:asparagine synthase (glutamine-hydrolysing)